VNRKALDTGQRLSIYGIDLDNLHFDAGEKTLARGSLQVEDSSITSAWQKKGGVQQVDTVDAADMFGDFSINVDSTAKPGTELGFEFKAILDNDYKNFNADDFDFEINSSSIVLSGVSQCWECKKSIMNPEDGVTAFGCAYHRHCVKCSETGKDFTDGGDAYEGEDGKVYGKAAWEKKFQKVCSTCSKPIKKKNPLEAKGKFYHRKCFTCQVCEKVLDGRWYEEDGRPICENDYYRKRGLVCPACDLHVEGEGVTVGKYKLHAKCYNCAYCRREPEGFFRSRSIGAKGGSEGREGAQGDGKRQRIYCAPCFSRIYPSEESAH